MRLIGVKEIKGNEILARPIIDGEGRVLLKNGMKLQVSYAIRLDEMGIMEVFIEDGLSEGIVPEEVVMAETKIEAKRIISAETKRLQEKRQLNIMEIHKIVDLLINDILSSKQNLMNVKDMRLKDESIFSHSVNTAILAALMIKRLGYRYDKLVNIVSGCLLHDLGKIILPQDIAVKDPMTMTTEELEVYKTHARLGYEMLKNKDDISPTERVIVLMHHERLDGSGFPAGLHRDKIQDAAKICAICNSFDNFLNDPNRKGLTCTSDAIEFVHSMSDIYFDKEIVKEFMKYIPIYPAGTMVLLSNGFVGLVSKNNETNLLRPVVRICFDIKSKQDIKPYEVDLMKELTLRIEGEFRATIHNS